MWKLIVLAAVTIQAITAFKIVPQANVCTITPSSLKPHEPIVVLAETNEFVYPNATGRQIILEEGVTLRVSCPGGELKAGSHSGKHSIETKCVSGFQFTVDGSALDFRKISCSRNPFHTAKKTGRSCENNGEEIQIGFQIDDDLFVPEIVICFDPKTLNPLYSTYNLTKYIGEHESGVARPSFIEDDFYNLDERVNDLYVRRGQKATINKLLGLAAASTKYIKDNNDFFLSRGHLTAKADFVYAAQQTSTFHYVNVAPQWQTFNGNNWNTVEGDVRDYADAQNVDLRVWTGTYGIATLPHEETGEETELFLYADSTGKTALPVPELYWKVAYNPATQLAVALIGVNNPYIKETEKYVICEDVSAQLKWLSWKKNDIEWGYSYACTIEDLRKKVTYLPEFPVKGLLL